MKKTLTLLAILAAIGPAWGAEVVSSNIVGYKKITLSAGYNQLGEMFTQVGGASKTIANIFADNSIFTSGEADSEADYITIWNGDGYDTYFFSSDAGDAWASGDDSFSETEDNLPLDTGFWLFRRGAEVTATLNGEVVTTNITTTVAADDYTMIANPFAAPLPIKSLIAAGNGFTAGEADSEADYITVWNGDGYDTYFFSSDAGDAWASGDDSFSETDDSIDSGKSFWLFHRGNATTVTLPVPY